MEMIPMGALLRHHAERHGNRPALVDDRESVTWDELDRRANRWARAFQAMGVRQDDFVTIALPNGIELCVVAFAAWKLGATPHVINRNLPNAELRPIVNLAQPRLIIGLEEARVPGHRAVPADFLPQGVSDDPLPVAVAKYWKAMTSGGSTGRPKLIVDHNPSLADPQAPILEMRMDRTILNPGPLHHNAPFLITHSGLFAGNQVVVMTKFDAFEALRLMELHQVDWVMLVPTMMNRIWRLPEAQRNAIDLSHLRVVTHMASACAPWLKQAWIDWLGPERVFELYGGTERQGRTWITGTEWLSHKGSVGRVASGCRMKIVDEAGRELPTGQIGEIVLLPDGGQGSTYHYIGAEPKVLPGGWESLGDLGWMDEDGYLYLADRRTDMIVSGGINVYPAEVEAALAAHPDVLDAVVVGLPHDDMGHIIHAIIQPRTRPADLSDTESIRKFLAERIAKYKIPRSFEFIDEALRDDSGKVRRSQLRDERLSACKLTSREWNQKRDNSES
jgi:bile acid-coenzyme A ligase